MPVTAEITAATPQESVSRPTLCTPAQMSANSSANWATTLTKSMRVAWSARPCAKNAMRSTSCAMSSGRQTATASSASASAPDSSTPKSAHRRPKIAPSQIVTPWPLPTATRKSLRESALCRICSGCPTTAFPMATAIP